ncbi:MAG TPA: ATP-binding protein [Chitinophagaceae bacterium]|jgi:PAS domain S-box-containing protein|nr:ATP-binding protein [Chitinophagaceae bacterium]
MIRIGAATGKKRTGLSKKNKPAIIDDFIYRLAFNAAQATFISSSGTGKIIAVNKAACRLLDYSKKELLNLRWTSVILNDSHIRKIIKHTAQQGHFMALVSVIRKDGLQLHGEITAAFFSDGRGNDRMITTIKNLSRDIEQQKQVDIKKEEKVAHNITLAKSLQKTIDTKNKKTVVRDINQALAKSDARLEEQMKSQDMQIANATADAKQTERQDISRELHDNVNQLLGASRLYIDLAKKGGKDFQLFLSRSSEYTLTAIEEIRKLTKRLTTDIIMNLGLIKAIENISRDTMEINPLKITLRLKSFKEETVDEKLQLALFRILQEQFNNILKHAKATRVIITLSQTKQFITFSLADNGVGFNTLKKSNGIGIENIKSRARAFNGSFDIISQPGRGCTMTARFPFKPILPDQLPTNL